jgi:hypothetical protein
MKKRIGIAVLLLGAIVLLAVWVNHTKTPSPTDNSNNSVSPPAAETPSAIVPATNVVAETPPPTNPPVVPVTPAPVETNIQEPVPVVAAPEPNPVAAPPETNAVPPAPVAPAVVAENSVPPTNKPSCSFIRNLLTGSFTNNLTDNQEFFYRVRAGFERADYGNTENTWLLAAKFYYRPQSWRDELKDSTNFLASLLIPDTFGVIDHSAIELVPDSGKPTAEEGVHAGVGFFWPWLNWRSKAPDDCLDGAIQFSFGPTINGGAEDTTSGSDPDLNWSRYGGVRLAASPDAFVEFTIGRNGDLPGGRQQVLGEIPIYRNHNSDFRYVLRGLWNAPTSGANGKSIFEAAILVEFPFEALEHPSKFINLIPFTN